MTHYSHCGSTSLYFDSHSIPYFEPITYSAAPSQPYPTIMDYDYGHPATNTSSYVPGDAFNPELYYDLQIPFSQALYALDAQTVSQTFSQQAPAMLEVPVSPFVLTIVTRANCQNNYWDPSYAPTHIPNPLPLDAPTLPSPSQHSEPQHTRTPSAQSLDKVLPPESFSGPIPTHAETETFLRHYLSQRRPKDMAVIVPDHQPLSLSCLPDPTRGKSQPPYHLRTLTLLAIWGSPRKLLKLHEIVQSICHYFPYYTKEDKLKVCRFHSLTRCIGF